MNGRPARSLAQGVTAALTVEETLSLDASLPLYILSGFFNT
jgi:hypothetical protein